MQRLPQQQDQWLRNFKRGGFLPGDCPHRELVKQEYVRKAERPADPPAVGTVPGFELTDKGNEYLLSLTHEAIRKMTGR